MIICPRCSQENKDSAVNCVSCRVNLQWALENPDEAARDGLQRAGGLPLQAIHAGHEGGAGIEKKRARTWYWWLWLSPLLTIPSLLVLYSMEWGYELVCPAARRGCDWDAAERVTLLIAILGSALWHLILLIPARSKESAFVRWHGRQALLLAGLRTAIPLAFGLGFGEDYATLLAIPALVLVWFVGTLWGQLQAARGDCGLMRWFGQGELLPTLAPAPEVAPAKARDEQAVADALVRIIRFSRDAEQRGKALASLERRGMVEPL